MSLLRLDHIGRTYDMGHVQVEALRDVSMTIEQGEMVAIVGPSGSGKTTMMSIIGCLDRPTNGRYELDGTDVGSLDDSALARIRSRTIGFVFQSYNLLPGTTAVDNVATPLLYQGVPRRERQARAAAELERLGMGHRLRHEPTELSGGEQQRVALARALVTKPALILADEPTGNLALHQGQEVLQLFQALNAAGHTILLITHNPEVAEVAGRRIHLLDGAVVHGEQAA
jgi:putative ABC transport system ATP-binding protein